MGLDPNSCQVEVNRIASDETARYILIKSQNVENVMGSDAITDDNELVNVTQEVDTNEDKLLDTVTYDKGDINIMLNDSGNESSIDDLNDEVVDVAEDKDIDRAWRSTSDTLNNKVDATSSGSDRNTDIFDDKHDTKLDDKCTTSISNSDADGDVNSGKVGNSIAKVDDGKIDLTSVISNNNKGTTKGDIICDTVHTSSTTKVSNTVARDFEGYKEDESVTTKMITEDDKSESAPDTNDISVFCVKDMPKESVSPRAIKASTTGLTSSSIATASQPITVSHNTGPYSNTAQDTSQQPHPTSEVEIMSDIDSNSGMSINQLYHINCLYTLQWHL